jgi:hypothetical protein
MEAKARKAPALTVVADINQNRGWKPMLATTLIGSWIRWTVIARMRGGMRRTVPLLVAHILSEDIMDARGKCIDFDCYWLICLAVA